MADLQQLQEDLHIWRMRNFPDATPNQQFLGMVEEMGEMAHAMLKTDQQIRGAVYEDIKDAIADLTIFMMGFCSLMGWDLSTLVAATASNIVMRRDWITYPTDGMTE